MITLIKQFLGMTGRQWRIGGTLMDPSEEDIRAALDEAAIRLYPEKDGVVLTTGGLLVQKTFKGFDVYVHVGEYK